MTERVVPTVRTPVDMRTFAHAVDVAWQELFLGAPARKEQAGVIWAQYGIETGAGPACWCWNIGNIKHVQGDGFDYYMLRDTWEMIHGEKVVFQPPHPATWFRAYPDLATAMAEHLRFLRRPRYAKAWLGVETGDCELFARLLHEAGYFTASASAYAAGLIAHHDHWMASRAWEDATAMIPVDVVHPDVPLDAPAEPDYDAPDDQSSDRASDGDPGPDSG